MNLLMIILFLSAISLNVMQVSYLMYEGDIKVRKRTVLIMFLMHLIVMAVGFLLGGAIRGWARAEELRLIGFGFLVIFGAIKFVEDWVGELFVNHLPLEEDVKEIPLWSKPFFKLTAILSIDYFLLGLMTMILTFSPLVSVMSMILSFTVFAYLGVAAAARKSSVKVRDIAWVSGIVLMILGFLELISL